MSCRTNEAPREIIDLVEQCRIEAESSYRSGRYNCAEAVLAVVRNHFRPDLPGELVQTASGFGGGSGSGCICGAISGGTIGLGVVLGDDRKRITRLTRELHGWFRERYGVTCCRSIREEQPKGVCPTLTGEVAARVAEMLGEGDDR